MKKDVMNENYKNNQFSHQLLSHVREKGVALLSTMAASVLILSVLGSYDLYIRNSLRQRKIAEMISTKKNLHQLLSKVASDPMTLVNSSSGNLNLKACITSGTSCPSSTAPEEFTLSVPLDNSQSGKRYQLSMNPNETDPNYFFNGMYDKNGAPHCGSNAMQMTPDEQKKACAFIAKASYWRVLCTPSDPPGCPPEGYIQVKITLTPNPQWSSLSSIAIFGGMSVNAIGTAGLTDKTLPPKVAIPKIKTQSKLQCPSGAVMIGITTSDVAQCRCIVNGADTANGPCPELTCESGTVQGVTVVPSSAGTSTLEYQVVCKTKVCNPEPVEMARANFGECPTTAQEIIGAQCPNANQHIEGYTFGGCYIEGIPRQYAAGSFLPLPVDGGTRDEAVDYINKYCRKPQGLKKCKNGDYDCWVPYLPVNCYGVYATCCDH